MKLTEQNATRNNWTLSGKQLMATPASTGRSPPNAETSGVAKNRKERTEIKGVFHDFKTRFWRFFMKIGFQYFKGIGSLKTKLGFVCATAMGQTAYWFKTRKIFSRSSPIVCCKLEKNRSTSLCSDRRRKKKTPRWSSLTSQVHEISRSSDAIFMYYDDGTNGKLIQNTKYFLKVKSMRFQLFSR